MTLTAGPTQATSALSRVGTKIAWGNPGNALTSDNNYAKVVLNNSPNHESNDLQWVDFGFDLPSSSVISGIRVIIEKAEESTTGIVEDLGVYLCKLRFPTGSNLPNGNYWATSDTTYTYGSSSNKWGTTWTRDEICTSGFAVVLACTTRTDDGITATARVDNCHVTIYYDYTPTSIKSIDGVARASVKTVNGLAVASMKTYNGLA